MSRNAVELPAYACDDAKSKCLNRRRAQEAWDKVQHGFKEGVYSHDYAAGFKAGYADFLDNGGNGDPPAVPPFRYRLEPHQTPEGLRAIDDWYSGFRHGSAMARASGFRETIVIPLSAPPLNAVERDPVLHVEFPTLAAQPELLPPPQKGAPGK